MDGFEFDDSLGSLAHESDEEIQKPEVKKKNLKDMFSDDSDEEKPKTFDEKSGF